MADQVILVVTGGPIKGQRFVFEQRKRWRFGRAEDCDVRLLEDGRTSRYHFELEVDPPDVELYDLGSLHGTFINGVKHGGRQEGKLKKAVARRLHEPVVLHDGDEIGVGRHLIRVEIEFEGTIIIGGNLGARTQLDEELEQTIIIGAPSDGTGPHEFAKGLRQQKPADQPPAEKRGNTVILSSSHRQTAVNDQSKTVVEPYSAQAPYNDQAKTVVEPYSAQQPVDDEAKTVVEPYSAQEGVSEELEKTVIISPASHQQPPVDDQAKTVVEPYAAQQPYDDQSKTVVGPYLAQQPVDDQAKTVVAAYAAQPPVDDQAKTVVAPYAAQQPYDDQSKTVVAPYAAQPPVGDQSKTVVGAYAAQPPVDDQAKTVVELYAAQPPYDDQAKTVVEPYSGQEGVSEAASYQQSPVDDQAKTVIEAPSAQSAYDHQANRVVQPVLRGLTAQQEVARNALLELLKDLGIKALSRDPKLGAYRIEKRIGKGGFGKVFQARHRQSRQPVAIKIIRPRAAVNEYVRKSFKREIDNARRLHHPNIVQLLDDGLTGGMFYFIMEFCDGGNLSQLIRTHRGKVPLLNARPIMRQALTGLAFIHERGYIHRDLKPDNILLTNTADGLVAKIADLGLSKGFVETGINGGLTVTGVRVGTGPYMSREQLINFKYVAPVSDVWSIGATFYVMLTGHYPRQGPSNLKNNDLVLRGQIVPIRQRDPNIPYSIAKVIDRALKLDITKRYQTAGEMLDALEKVW